MRLGDHVGESGGDPPDEFGMRGGRRRGVARQRAEVVHPLQQDRPARAAAIQHVALETVDQSRPAAVVQHAVAADPGIHQSDRPGRGVAAQACGQHIGPAAVALRLHAVAVGDRIPHRDDRGGTGRLHVDAGQPVPARHRLGPRQVDVRHMVANAQEAGGARTGVTGLRRGHAGQVQADRNIGGGRQGHGDRVGPTFFAGRDGDGGLAGEAQRLRRVRARRAGGRGQCHRRGIDGQRFGAKDIGQQHAHPPATGRDAHDLAQRDVAGPGGRPRRVAPCRHLCGTPASLPAIGRRCRCRKHGQHARRQSQTLPHRPSCMSIALPKRLARPGARISARWKAGRRADPVRAPAGLRCPC